MSIALDYLDHLARESARFAEAVLDARPDAPVPSCPDWNADDLLWHLGEVQWLWATVVRDNVSGARADELKPDRPADRTALADFFATASRSLSDTLATRAPETPAWTWSEDQTVGFIRRRQAHEALIHRVDAELTAGSRTPMDAALSADGVDEALRIMYGGVPPWGRFSPDGRRTVRVLAADTDDSWFVSLGRFTGTDPDHGKAYDEPDLQAADEDSGDPAAATVKGGAADLDCWLWHRPTIGPVERSGDEDVLSAFESTIASGID